MEKKRELNSLPNEWHSDTILPATIINTQIHTHTQANQRVLAL